MLFTDNAEEPDAARTPSDATPSADVVSLAGSMNTQQKSHFAAMLLTPMPKSPAYLGLVLFLPLNDENVRNELNLSSEQDKKLREMSDVLRAQMKKWEELPHQQQPPTKEQLAQQHPEFIEEVKAARKQVKELLTAEQSTIFKNAVLRQRLIIRCHRSEDSQKSEKLNLTDDQKKQFARLFEEIVKLRQPLRETTEKVLGILSAEHQKRLPEIDVSNPVFPSMPIIRITFPEQTATEIAEDKGAIEASDKKGMFTPQQLVLYKEVVRNQLILNPRFIERANLNLSEEQQKEVRGMRENWNDRIGQFSRELGGKCLAILTPQQREKLQEDVDRWWEQV